MSTGITSAAVLAPLPITATLVAIDQTVVPAISRSIGVVVEAQPPPSQYGSGLRLGPNAVLVPVKAFTSAKIRLAPALPPAERMALARAMAERVIAAAEAAPVAVVCDDRDVADWARALGALVIWEPGRGLNGAVDDGVRRLAAMGVQHVTVAHADLPLATDLSWICRFSGVTLVPDRREDGTNVIGVPAGSGFVFSYGPGSFARHIAEARRLNLPLRIARSTLLSWDVDLPADLGVAPLPA
jgi:2-phospho-L-lactate/phosphoenolpyruvate guanylyltransferase